MEAVGLSSLVLITVIVLGVLLAVIAVIAVVVLLPHVRRALAERAKASDAEVDRAGSEPQAPHGDRAVPRER